MNQLQRKYIKGMQAWDECAAVYEKQIVSGHPDIIAFENFEEDFLDRILRYLAENSERPLRLLDIGCGSGRLHLRYGAKTIDIKNLECDHPLVKLKESNSFLGFDNLLSEKLNEVWGIDFSEKMLDLARVKLKKSGISEQAVIPLTLSQGSAFELKSESKSVLPIAVCLVNSISVMQGPEGAMELFKSMRRAVENAGGVAVISCYQKEYIETYGLGQYESTLDVSGQPWWMVPDTYASDSYVHISHDYKRAYSQDPSLVVDVFDKKGNLVKENFTLRRDPWRTSQVIESGHIRTHSQYESQWYEYGLIDSWIKAYWPEKSAYHIQTKEMDAIRAEPAQMAILDPNNHLENLFARWNINK